jgi:hypothetical protein
MPHPCVRREQDAEVSKLGVVYAILQANDARAAVS